MKFLDDFKPTEYKIIFGIDASSTHIGIAVFRDESIEALVKIEMKQKEMHQRMKDLRLKIDVLIHHYNPEFVMIESPIMVQNPLTTKNLSYIAGIIIATCLDFNVDVEEVSPMTWKSWLGYKRLTKKIKEEIIKSLGQTEGTKEINKQKKYQVQNILTKRYPLWQEQLKDDNLADALGIALFAQNKLKERENAIKTI